METRTTILPVIWILALAIGALTVPVCGQLSHVEIAPLADNVILPQSGRHAFVPHGHGAIEITGVGVLIDIVEGVATTTVEIRLHNTTNRRQEAELIFPVPDRSAVKGFAYDGPAGAITAKVLSKEEARRIYNQLVSKMRDPALVEFIGYNLIRSSVFPVEPHGKQKVRLTYEHVLNVDGARFDYVLPRSESLAYSVPWQVKVDIKSKRPISTVYSPSHTLTTKRISDRHFTAATGKGKMAPGPFRVSYLIEKNGVTASMLAYPDGKVGGGYFLLLAGLPASATAPADGPAL